MPSPRPFLLNTGMRFSGCFLSKPSLKALSRSLSFCCNTCEGHSARNEYSSDRFQRVSQKASSLYQSIPWRFSRRSRFMARALFQTKREEPQNLESFDSISSLVFSLNIYAFWIVCITLEYTKNECIMQVQTYKNNLFVRFKFNWS